MQFKQYVNLLQAHLTALITESQNLFVVDANPDELWELYLNSFPVEFNGVFRVRRSYDCGCCRAFVRQFGAVVGIVNHRLVSIWDFEPNSAIFSPVNQALSSYVVSHPIKDVFVTKANTIGTAVNYEQVGDQAQTWYHLAVKLPRQIINHSRSRPINEIKAQYRASQQVLARSLEELSPAAVTTVLDLINQNLLYRGAEWKPALTEFARLQSEFNRLPPVHKNIYSWEQFLKVGPVVARIRNHSIGTLLKALSDGVTAEAAVQSYERIVAPTNYKRPKAIFTQQDVTVAEALLSELGLSNSLGRRHATLDDLSINNVLFLDRTAEPSPIASGVFAELKQQTAQSARFKGAKLVSIDQFTQLLASARSTEIYFDAALQGNLVSLLAPTNPDSPSILKWSNGFSWAYAGNIADSIKQRVKELGGNVNGVLRFSIQWNEDGTNNNDFDAHAIEPNKNRIYFAQKLSRQSRGFLDVDVIQPITLGGPAVENITWTQADQMLEGRYEFLVHNYQHRGGRTGFSAQIEYLGQTYNFNYPNELKAKEYVLVAEVVIKNNTLEFVKSLPIGITNSPSPWGIPVNQFHPVSAVMLSPNYWSDTHGIGNKHYFFTIPGCVNSTEPNGFYNEFLIEELLQYRRVFEALGGKLKVAAVEPQLSGLGFSSTQPASFFCKLNQSEQEIYHVHI